MKKNLDIKKQKVYIQKDISQYRIGGKFTIIQAMSGIVLICSIILIVHKLFF